MSGFGTVKHKMKELEGKVVYVEGPYAILLPTQDPITGREGMRALYSPVVGKLVEVLEDGIVLKPDGGVDQIMPMGNIRSVQVFDQAKASGGGKTSPLLT